MRSLRFNTGKAELGRLLMFGTALDDVAMVLAQGAIKYEDGNWLLGGKPDSEYMDAALRHLVRHQEGELYDPETGCKHIAHAAWNLLALLTLNHKEPARDEAFDQEGYEQQYRRQLNGAEGLPYIGPDDDGA